MSCPNPTPPPTSPPGWCKRWSGCANRATPIRRASGADPARLTQPGSPPELVAKALKKKPFAARLLAALKHPDSPVALAEDADRLADSPSLIELALSLLCTPQKRLHPPSRLITKVDKALKPAFGAALQRRLAEKSLPPAVGVVEVRGKPQLYLRALPPPAVELSQKLVRTLEAIRSEGEDAYPPSWKGLITRTDPAAGPALVKEAMRLPPFAGRALFAAPRDPDAPMALAEDRDTLLGSAALLEYALAAVRKPDHQAVPPTDLKKKTAKPLQAAFEAAVIARVAAQRLPPAVGCLYVKKKPHLFLLRDVVPASGGRQPPDASTTSPMPSSHQGADAPRSPRRRFAPPSTPRSTGWTAKRDRTTSSICWTCAGPCRPTTPRSTPACSSCAGTGDTPSAPPRAVTASRRRSAKRGSSRRGRCCCSCHVAADDSRSCKPLISAANRPARRFGLHSRQSGVGDILYGQRFALFAPRRRHDDRCLSSRRPDAGPRPGVDPNAGRPDGCLGGVPLERIRFHPAPGTALEQDVLEAEKQGLLCELVDGVLVEKAMGYTESILAAFLIEMLNAFVRPRNLGFVQHPGRDHASLPRLSASPTCLRRLGPTSRRPPADGADPTDRPGPGGRGLSQSNTPGEMARKRHDYFTAGVPGLAGGPEGPDSGRLHE